MSNTLWVQILQLVRQKDWPHEESTSNGSQSRYEAGLDLVNSYRGDPDILDALEQFQTCGSAGYAKAGIAAVLMTSAYERGDDYYSSGLLSAEAYLTEYAADAS